MIAALYALIFVLLEVSYEDQSLSHSRPKEVVAHWILQSSYFSIRQSSVTVLPRYLKECTFARCVPLTDNGFLTAEFWSDINGDHNPAKAALGCAHGSE